MSLAIQVGNRSILLLIFHVGKKRFSNKQTKIQQQKTKTIRIPQPGNLIFGLMNKCQQMQRALFKLENISFKQN